MMMVLWSLVSIDYILRSCMTGCLSELNGETKIVQRSCVTQVLARAVSIVPLSGYASAATWTLELPFLLLSGIGVIKLS